jgi:hypothetical protein
MLYRSFSKCHTRAFPGCRPPAVNVNFIAPGTVHRDKRVCLPFAVHRSTRRSNGRYLPTGALQRCLYNCLRVHRSIINRSKPDYQPSICRSDCQHILPNSTQLRCEHSRTTMLQLQTSVVIHLGRPSQEPRSQPLISYVRPKPIIWWGSNDPVSFVRSERGLHRS